MLCLSFFGYLGLGVCFARLVLSELVYADANQPVSTSGGIGNAVWCTHGACRDGTSIDQKPGLCSSWSDPCHDFDAPPTCGPHQVVGGFNCGTCHGIDAGYGFCYVGYYPWWRSNWTWTCYQCPTGYVGVNLGSCENSPYWTKKGQNPPGNCVKCSSPTETLTGSPKTGYKCLQQTCAGSGGTPVAKRAGESCPICVISERHKDMLKEQEGLPGSRVKFCAKLGDRGCAVQTLGWGHDCNAHNCAKLGCDKTPQSRKCGYCFSLDCKHIPQPMSEAKAEELLDADISEALRFLLKNLPNADLLNANQLAALVDYVFNTGYGSTKYLDEFFKKDMEDRNFDAVCKTLANAYTCVDKGCCGKGTTCKAPKKGKVNRRYNESTLCSTPDSTFPCRRHDAAKRQVQLNIWE